MKKICVTCKHFSVEPERENFETGPTYWAPFCDLNMPVSQTDQWNTNRFYRCHDKKIKANESQGESNV